MTKIKYVFAILLVFVLVMASSLFCFASTPTITNDSPVYFDFEPLPVGFFDGDMTADSQSISLNFNNLSDSESGTIHSEGLDRYSITLPASFETYSFTGSYSGQSTYDSNGVEYSGGNITITGGTQSGTNVTATVSQTANGDDSYSGTHDYSGTVTGSIQETTNTDKRWLSFSLVLGIGYVWFTTDVRNSVNLYCTSTSDPSVFSVSCRIEGGYRAFCIVCNSDGSFSRSVDNGSSGSAGSMSSLIFNSNLRSSDYGNGTGSQWGLWQSEFSPSMKGLSSLTSGKKWFRSAVFGSQSLEFLMWQQTHSDLVSLRDYFSQGLQSQTAQLLDENAPGNFDQSSMGSTDSMLSLESSLHAPSTNSIFSAGNTFTDGMGFWRDRMNELLFPSNSPITALTIFSLTLGMAVLVIGRRVSGGGSA